MLTLPRTRRWLKHWSTPFRRPATRRPHRRLALELLEDRIVPTTNLSYNDWAHLGGTDAAGNPYVYGSIAQTADIDPGSGTSWLSGGPYYLAKYSPDKTLLWSQRADSLFQPDSRVVSEASYSSGGQDFVYVMEGSPTSGYRSIARLQDTGTGLTQLWRTQTVAWGNIAVGSDGSVYMAGYFSGTIDFDPSDPADSTPLTGDTLTSSNQAGFVGKWDSNGNFQWVRRVGGAGTTWANDVAVVNNGTTDTVYVGGMFDTNLVPDGYSGPALTDQGVVGGLQSQDGYLVGYDPTGALVSVGHFVDAYVNQVTGDASGTYIAGTHAQPALGFSSNGLYFGKLDPSGQNFTWVRQINYQDYQPVKDLAVSSGSLLMTGNFDSITDFDPNAGTSTLDPSGGQAYVASYSATDRAFQWAKQMGSLSPHPASSGEAGYSLAVAGSNVFVGGAFAAGQAPFGPDTLTNLDYGESVDGFVARLNKSDGVIQGALSVASVVRTIDDGEAGYTETGNGWKTNTKAGFDGETRWHVKGSGANKATWSFSGLPAGSYEVQLTWNADKINATNAPFSVNGGSPILVNQQVAPSDYSSDSTYWKSLGQFSVSSTGTLTVQLTDAAKGNVVADAVRVVLKSPAATTAPLMVGAAVLAGPMTSGLLTSPWPTLGQNFQHTGQSSSIGSQTGTPPG